MNEFTYQNIFETKGIEYIITIIFFALLIPFYMLLTGKAKVNERKEAVKGVINSAILQVPGGLFVNKNHTWAFLQRSGLAKIGLDNLIVKIIGNVKIQYLKGTGDTIKKGELVARLINDEKQLDILSPISGILTDKNASINVTVDQLLNDPYGSGWLVEIKPENWRLDTNKFYFGSTAVEWFQMELDRFKEFLARSVQSQPDGNPWLVLQDGGELNEHPLSEMPEMIWVNFQEEFLNKTS